MTLRACGREKDVQELLRAGHWPVASGEELRAHVAECRRCGDLVLVAETLQSAKAGAYGARMDAAGVIWWRAQLRKKSVAMQAVSRPMVGAQVFALLLGVVAAVGLLVVWMRGGAWTRVAAAGQSGVERMHALWLGASMSGGSGLLVMATGIGMVAILGGFAVFAALDRRETGR
jgi:hypothetical protein